MVPMSNRHQQRQMSMNNIINSTYCLAVYLESPIFQKQSIFLFQNVYTYLYLFIYTYLCVYLFIYVYLQAHMQVCALAHKWRSKDNLWELVLFFCHMGSGDQTHVIRLVASAWISEPIHLPQKQPQKQGIDCGFQNKICSSLTILPFNLDHSCPNLIYFG